MDFDELDRLGTASPPVGATSQLQELITKQTIKDA